MKILERAEPISEDELQLRKVESQQYLKKFVKTLREAHNTTRRSTLRFKEQQ